MVLPPDQRRQRALTILIAAARAHADPITRHALYRAWVDATVAAIGVDIVLTDDGPRLAIKRFRFRGRTIIPVFSEPRFRPRRVPPHAFAPVRIRHALRSFDPDAPVIVNPGTSASWEFGPRAWRQLARWMTDA